jgi:serine/threonine-protein kinase
MSTSDPDSNAVTLPQPASELGQTVTMAEPPGKAALGLVVPKIPGYEIIAELGRGGMGVVFKARQTSANRLVALKMILTGQLASPADVDRFRAEAEAAARLDHPHIIPIYEVGEHDGVQFFSMKLVEHGTLADWLKTHQRSHGARRVACATAVGILAKVARAVHHAHQRGILHRDLKPANILMSVVSSPSSVAKGKEQRTTDDGQLTPHVTDFGLAKRVEGESKLTQTGAIMGTPSYMAPEQARATKSLSTAADVYSLGAILYESLTGRPPFVAPSPFDTIMQVLEKEPAPPRRLDPAIDRDLEIICLKCLEKDPVRRYGSAEALADELERWLRGEAIVARPVGQFERTWRWARRNPVVATLAGTLTTVVCVALIAVTLLYFGEQHQRQRAETQEAAALGHLEEVNRQKERAETSYRLARTALEDMVKIRDDPRLQSGPLEDLKKQFARAEGAFYEKFLQLKGDEPSFQAERARALAGYSALSYQVGNMEQALQQIREAVAINESLRKTLPNDADLTHRLADNYTQVGVVCTKLGKLDEAIQAKSRAVELYDSLLARDPTNIRLLDTTAMSRQNLGVAYRGAGRFEEGEKALREALTQLEKTPGKSERESRSRTASMAIIWSNLAEFYPRMNRPQDAMVAYEKALALYGELVRQEPEVEVHKMNVAGVLNNLGLFLRDHGKEKEAAESWNKAIATFAELVRKHPTVNQYRHALAMTHDNLGMLRARTGEPAKAREHYDQALALWTKLHAENPKVVEYISDLGCVQRNLGDLERGLSKIDAALDWYAKAIATLETSPQRNQAGMNSHTWLHEASYKRAVLLIEQRRFGDAVIDWDRVVDLEKGSKAETRLQRAVVLARAGEHGRAVKEADFLAGLPDPPAEALYTLARVWALAAAGVPSKKDEYAKQALRQLQQAERGGFFKDQQRLADLKKDQDFKSLQTNPEFAAFVKSLEKPN